MTVNRRSFLASATTAAIGSMLFDPEKLLWVPGQRSYFDIRRPVRVLGLGTYAVRPGELITTASYSHNYRVVDKTGTITIGMMKYITNGAHIVDHSFDRVFYCPCLPGLNAKYAPQASPLSLLNIRL